MHDATFHSQLITPRLFFVVFREAFRPKSATIWLYHVQHNERLWVIKLSYRRIKKFCALTCFNCNKIKSSSRAIIGKNEWFTVRALERGTDVSSIVAKVMTTLASARAKAFFRHHRVSFVNTCFSLILVYLPIVIYIPSLDFNQVTVVNIHVTTWFVVIICVLYVCRWIESCCVDRCGTDIFDVRSACSCCG